MLDQLDALVDGNTNIHLLCGKYTKTWTCSIERSGDQIELRLSSEGDTAAEAVRVAVEKFERAINKGLPELQRVIEHRVVPDVAAWRDEEIPF